MAQGHAVQQGDLESQCAGPQTCAPLLVHSASLQVIVKTSLEPQSVILVSARQLRAKVFCKCFLCLSGLHMEVMNSLKVESAS